MRRVRLKMMMLAIKITLFIFVVIPILIFIIMGVLYLIGIISLSPLILWFKVTEFFDKKNLDARSEDEIFNEAIRIVCQYDKTSASLLQRRLSIGYAQADRILNKLQKVDVVSAGDGSKPRDVLIHNADDFIHDFTISSTFVK